MKLRLSQSELEKAIGEHVARKIKDAKVKEVKFRFTDADRKTIYAEVEIKS